MNIQLLIEDSVTGEKLDISELAQEITWSTSLNGTAGQLSFNLTPSDLNPSNGSKVWFSIPGKADIFMGYVFTTSLTRTKTLNVVCYDQTRYLKNAGVYIFKNMAAHEIFEKICKDYQLKYEVAARVNYICAPATRDNRSLMDMIQLALDETFVKTGEYLFVRDNFGVLTLDNLSNYRRDYLFDKDLLTIDFSYSRSIDEDTASSVKLVRQGKSQNKTQISCVTNTEMVNRWGILLHYETIKEEGTQQELDDRAKKLLELKGRPTEKLSFTTDGKGDVYAGCGLFVKLDEISKDKINKFCIVNSAKHIFKNQEHQMQIEVLL